MDLQKTEAQIEQVVPISVLLEQQKKSRWVPRSILSYVLSAVEKHLQKGFYVLTPQTLSDFSVQPGNLTEPAAVAKRLQSSGIIVGIQKNRRSYDDEPKLTSFRAWSHSNNPNVGYGSDLFDESAALWKAIGECQERFLWRYHDFYSIHGQQASYADIRQKAIHPGSLAGFSEKQKNERPNILAFDDSTIFSWTPAIVLYAPNKRASGALLCPTQLLSNHYSKKNVRHPGDTSSQKEPLLRWCITTGLASGSNRTDALVSGILEIIERDAFMINYLNKLSPAVLDLSYIAKQDTEIDQVLKTCEQYGLDVQVVQLATDFPVHVLLGIIREKGTHGPALVVAASADFDIRTALLDTLAETLSVRRMARSLQLEIDSTKPHTFEQDHRVKYWSLPEQKGKLDFLLTGTRKQIDLPPKLVHKHTRHDKRELQTLVAVFKEKKYGLYYVELSDSAKLKSGITTVNVLAPDMHPLHLNESIPYIYSDRLVKVPKALGYTPAKTLNVEPHPFP